MTRADINNVVLALAVGLLAMGGYGAWQGRDTSTPSPGPAPGPAPSPVVPSAELAKLVPDREFRAELSRFYSDLADLVQRDTAGKIETTEQFRDVQQAAVTLLTQRRGVGVMMGFNEAISQRVAVAIGLEPVAMDANKRTALVQVLTSIAGELAQ